MIIDGRKYYSSAVITRVFKKQLIKKVHAEQSVDELHGTVADFAECLMAMVADPDLPIRFQIHARRILAKHGVLNMRGVSTLRAAGRG